MARWLIVNADDFGLSAGVNAGVVAAHTRGIVTSASLMVDAPAAEEARQLARDHAGLSVGLHWVGDGRHSPGIDLQDLDAVRGEFKRQIDRFRELLGSEPTHVDSHHHVHREPELMPVFDELVRPLGVPLRGDRRVAHVGGFYAQWEWKVTDLHHVSVAFLQWLLAHEVIEGWTEIACHPALTADDLRSVYREERVAELETLTDPRARGAVNELGIRLVSYRDWLRHGAETGRR